MNPLAIQDISQFEPLIEKFANIKEKYGDEYPIILYEPNIECQEKTALKDLIQGNNSIHFFSEFKEAFKFVQSLGISFILILPRSMEKKTVLQDFRSGESTYCRAMFDFEEEALLKDIFQGISDEKIKSLELKVYVSTFKIRPALRERVNEDEEEVMVMCDLKTMAKEFREDFAIIWYDPKIDSKRKSDLENDLGIKIEEKNIFIDFSEFYRRIKNYVGSPYHLIVSRRDKAEKILNGIDSLKDLLCIYIYDDDSEKISDEKIEIQKTLQQLIPKIKEGFRTKSKLINTFPSFATNFDAVDKSHTYYLHYYLKGLINFKNRKQAKGDFVKLARQIYQDQKGLLEKFETEYDKYDGIKMLHWYTKDSPVYKLLNNCLRIASSDSILYSRFVLKDIEEAIREQYQRHPKRFNGLAYRGAYISTEEWEKLERNIGEEIEMYGFLSTTVNQRIAVNFFRGDMKNKIFITIIVPPLPELDEQGFADVSESSEFKGEREILFNVRSRFRILEARTSKIDNRGTQGRHLVLLYGARPLRKYMTKHKPEITVELKLPSEVKCNICSLSSKLFLFQQEITEMRCLDCLIKNSVPQDTPLFALNSENKIEDVKLKGQMLKFYQTFNFSNSGYKCQNCQITGKESYYKWIDLKTSQQFVQCSDCFKNKIETGCQIFVAESSPYALWQEYQAEWERVDTNYQAEVALTVKYEDQGGVFEAVQKLDFCLEYEKKVVSQLKRRRWREKEKLERFFNIGRASQESGALKQALMYLEEVMNMTKILFGEKHLKAANCTSSLASVYKSLGELPKALECEQQSLDITEKIFGDKNPQTATAYHNLSVFLQHLGHYQEALKYCLKSLLIFEAFYGKNHPKTAESYNNIGAAWSYLGKVQKALECCEKALEIRKNIFGDKHPSTAESYNNVAELCAKLGENKKALKYHKRVVQIAKGIYGENNEKVAISYNNLALAFEDSKKYQQAFECYDKALKIKKTLFGKKHSQVAISYSNLGSLYHTVGQYKKSLEYLEKSREIIEAALGVDHPETATVYNALGLTYNDLKQYKKALQYHEKALKIRKTKLGGQHPDTTVSYHNLGIAYLQSGQRQKAKEYLEKSEDPVSPIASLV